MMHIDRRNLVGVAAIAMMLAISASGAMAADPLSASGGRQQWASARGLYNLSYASEIEPIAINRIHDWIMHVTMADGQLVENADIEVIGGMPAHDHGLPTRPRVTDYLGNGDYRIAGMRFHMQGDWEIRITVSSDDKTDVVTIPLQL